MQLSRKTNNKPQNLIKKQNGAKELSKFFPKVDIKWPTGARKGCTSLIMRGMQMKTTLRHCLMPVCTLLLTPNTSDKGVNKRESLYCVGGMKIGTAIMQNSGEVPQQANNRNATGCSKPTAGTEDAVPETAPPCPLQSTHKSKVSIDG